MSNIVQVIIDIFFKQKMSIIDLAAILPYYLELAAGSSASSTHSGHHCMSTRERYPFYDDIPRCKYTSMMTSWYAGTWCYASIPRCQHTSVLTYCYACACSYASITSCTNITLYTGMSSTRLAVSCWLWVYGHGRIYGHGCMLAC